MFHGPANLMLRSRVWWVFAGAVVASVLVFAVGILLPGHQVGMLHPGHQSKLIGAVVKLISAVVAVGTVALIPRALKPKVVPVALYVDQSGIYADNAPLVLRQDIAEAYIRPASDARASHPLSAFSITTPAWPLTVVLITRKGRNLHIDPGGQGPAAGILTALGFPVTVDAPGYESRASKRGRRWIIGGSMVTALYIAALVGYAYYRSIGH